METGEQWALVEQLYDENRQKIFLYAAHFLCEQDAEDIVQDVVTELVIHPKKLEGRSRQEISAYMMRIARSRCIDLLRKQGYSRKLWEKMRKKGEARLELLAPDRRVLGAEMASTLQRCLRRLAPEYRIVLECALEKQWKYREIAGQLQMTPAAVRYRLARGRALLKKMMEEAGYTL